MMMGPGGYQTKDLAKVGIGLSILIEATAVILLSMQDNFAAVGPHLNRNSRNFIQTCIIGELHMANY